MELGDGDEGGGTEPPPADEPDPTDPLIEDNIKPTRGGQLYIFVNDAVIGFPGLYGAFYRNNKGTGQLTVTRTR